MRLQPQRDSPLPLASRLAFKGGNALRFFWNNRRADDSNVIRDALNQALQLVERRFSIKAQRQRVDRNITPRKSSFNNAVRSHAAENYDTQIRAQSTEFIPFDHAWSEVLALVSRLDLPD